MIIYYMINDKCSSPTIHQLFAEVHTIIVFFFTTQGWLLNCGIIL